jgi:hypothetical protein
VTAVRGADYAGCLQQAEQPIEFRARPMTIIGERFYIDASRQSARRKLYFEGCRAKPDELVLRSPLSVASHG